MRTDYNSYFVTMYMQTETIKKEKYSKERIEIK